LFWLQVFLNNGKALITLPASGSVLNMTQLTNIGIKGRWVFRVDGGDNQQAAFAAVASGSTS
jgi:hypothetical protein